MYGPSSSFPRSERRGAGWLVRAGGSWSQLEAALLQDPESLPDIVEMFRLYKPTISHLPPSTAADFSREFGKICERLAADMDNITTWVLFYLFPFAILPAAPKDRRIRRSGLSQTHPLGGSEHGAQPLSSAPGQGVWGLRIRFMPDRRQLPLPW